MVRTSRHSGKNMNWFELAHASCQGRLDPSMTSRGKLKSLIVDACNALGLHAALL